MNLRRGFRSSPLRSPLLVAAAMVAAGCGGGGSLPTSTTSAPLEVPSTELSRVAADEATGLAVDNNGRLLVGERLNGRIRAVDAKAGTVEASALLPDLDTELTQGGLLGLAVAGDGSVLASSTAGDGRLVIDRVNLDDGAVARRWTGPLAQEEANGGRLAVLADQAGTLLIGVGDLLNPDRAALPDSVNGKVMAIDADGGARPWADGFNNPFALDSDDGSIVWVADNAPGRRPERLLRVTEGRTDEVASWDDTRVPSGLAALDDGQLAICYFATGNLVLVDPDRPGDASGRRVADDCAYGVVGLPDERLAYSTRDEVVVLKLG